MYTNIYKRLATLIIEELFNKPSNNCYVYPGITIF